MPEIVKADSGQPRFFKKLLETAIQAVIPDWLSSLICKDQVSLPKILTCFMCI
jgi:hypothetical protein